MKSTHGQLSGQLSARLSAPSARLTDFDRTVMSQVTLTGAGCRFGKLPKGAKVTKVAYEGKKGTCLLTTDVECVKRVEHAFCLACEGGGWIQLALCRRHHAALQRLEEEARATTEEVATIDVASYVLEALTTSTRISHNLGPLVDVATLRDIPRYGVHRDAPGDAASHDDAGGGSAPDDGRARDSRGRDVPDGGAQGGGSNRAQGGSSASGHGRGDGCPSSNLTSWSNLYPSSTHTSVPPQPILCPFSTHLLSQPLPLSTQVSCARGSVGSFDDEVGV